MVAHVSPMPGRFGKTFASLCSILRSFPDLLPGKLEWNEMLHAPTCAREQIDDVFSAQLRERIEVEVTDSKGKGLAFTTTDIDQALNVVAKEHPYHPVREYLNGLVWDERPRIMHVQEDVLGTKPSDLHLRIMKAWFISAVARAMKPGVKVDTVLILHGPQGAMKSTFFKTLAGPWFADSPIDIENKDALMMMSRVWILEWGELEAMQRARDAAALKAFLASPTDTYRPPYGRRVVEVPRSCVIVGSTNEEEILADATGNRRYWIIPTSDYIEIDILQAWRDQLWAEAVWWWRQGEPHYLDWRDDAALRADQVKWEKRDPWEEAIDAWTQTRVTPFTIGELLDGALSKPAASVTRADQMRAASVLKQLEFKRIGSDGRGGRKWSR